MSTELKKVSAGGKFLGSIVLFLVFAFLFWFGGLLSPVWRHFAPDEKDLDQKRAEARVAKRETLEKENEQKLSTYAWVNKDKGVVQIPIDRAMELVAADLAAKPVKASNVKLEHPYPYGLQDLTAAPAAASGTAKPAVSGSAAPAASGTAATPPPPAASGTVAPAAPPVPAATPTPGQ